MTQSSRMKHEHGSAVVLPDATDLAAMVRRAGIEEVAADFGCHVNTIRHRLNDSGYTRGGLEDSGEFIFPEWDPKPWEVDAVCASTDPEAFFPDKGGSNRPAKAVCWGSCPVREECLDYALRHGIEFGVWGGLSYAERQALSHAGQEAA